MGGIKRRERAMGKHLRLDQGFTLIEVMIVVVIVAVLAALAAPSFIDATLSSRLGTLANKFVASAHLARSEAIKRNSVITMCTANTAGTECAPGSWEQGWIVMCPTDLSDPTAAGFCVAGGPDTLVFHHEQAAPTGFKIIEQSGTPLESLNFQPTGVGADQAIFRVCRATPTVGSQEREIEISITGRPSVKTETGDCT